MEEAKKMKCYKRLVYKQFVQVSGLCGPQFLSYSPKHFTHLCRALYIWRRHIGALFWCTNVAAGNQQKHWSSDVCSSDLRDLHKTNLGDNQTFYQVNVESCVSDFSLHFAFSFNFMNLRQRNWRKMRPDIECNIHLSTFLRTKSQKALKKILQQVL